MDQTWNSLSQLLQKLISCLAGQHTALKHFKFINTFSTNCRRVSTKSDRAAISWETAEPLELFDTLSTVHSLYMILDQDTYSSLFDYLIFYNGWLSLSALEQGLRHYLTLDDLALNKGSSGKFLACRLLTATSLYLCPLPTDSFGITLTLFIDL